MKPSSLVSSSSSHYHPACFLAFKQSPQATLILNKTTGLIEYANRACSKLFETAVTQLSQTPVKELVRHDILPKEFLHLCEKPHQPTPIFPFKNRLGDKLYLRLHCVFPKELKNTAVFIVHVENCTDTIKGREYASQFSSEIILAHEEEKKLLSQEIHDTICQSLAALKISLQSDAPKADTIREVTRLIHDTRSLAHHLRPEIIDDLGLIAALESLVADLNQRFSRRIKFTTHAKQCHLTPLVSLQFYRIAQEALHNAIKHANATKITLHLHQRTRHTTLTVSDNGKGFNLKQNQRSSKTQLGLKIMHERAHRIGTVIELHSVIGKGTIVKITYPTNHKKAATHAA